MTEIVVDTNQDNGREFRTVTASTEGDRAGAGST